MHTSRRVGRIAVCDSLALLAACSSTNDEASSGSPLSTAPPGTYGAPLDTSAPDPTDVATDPAPSTAPVPTEGPREDAVVQITYYGWNPDSSVVEVGGFLPFLVEDGGSCTLTLTQGAASATATRPATPNVTSTACGELVVPGDQLAPGTWSAVLAYDSERSTGATEPVEVRVP